MMINLWRISALVLVLCSLCVSVSAGASSDALPTFSNGSTQAAKLPWHAHWIAAVPQAGQPQKAGRNAWSCFRKNFDLAGKPASAVARISVDSKYWLWVNDKLVVFEGGLKRGPTPSDTYFDEVNLAPWLVPGKNTIAVMTWYWGKNGFSHKNSGRAGFLFELDAGGTRVISDASWKSLRNPAYGEAVGESPNGRLPESNVQFDARQDLGSWMSAKFNDDAWPVAGDLGVAGVEPWNGLHLRPIPLWKDYGLKDYANASALPGVANGNPIVAKLPYNAQITPYLSVSGSAGIVIGIRTGNYHEGPGVRAEYVMKEGLQEYESFGWMNGQEVIYDIPKGVEILALKYRETGYDTDFSGAFHCDDPFYDALWEKAARTLYITMRDTYMDCPDRERSQWWGDITVELGEAFYSLSPSANHLARKAINEVCAWQRPDKVLYSPMPGIWTKELPQQMLASVSYYGFWTYYLYSGDKQTVVNAYPHVRGYMSLWQIDEQGLVIHRKGGWDWADWGDHIDVRVLDQAWYCLALQGAANLARLAEKPTEAAAYEQIRRGVADATNRAMWNGSSYRTSDYKGATDDRANALCVLAGIADAKKFPGIKEVLAKEYHASPYMEKYVLEALMLMDEPDAALARMKKRYGPIVADSWTTLPEQWNGGTHNHAWSGGPLTILSQYAAGLTPIEPAWRQYQIRPRMGSLRKIKTVTDTVAGRISTAMEQSESRFSMELVSPPKTTALICLPIGQKPPQRVTVNGETVWRAGRPAGAVSGVKFKDTTNGYLSFLVSSGQWKFNREDTP